MFFMNFIDIHGVNHSIGNIKIGFEGQSTKISTYEKIQEIFDEKSFNALPENFFSLATDVEFYNSIIGAKMVSIFCFTCATLPL